MRCKEMVATLLWDDVGEITIRYLPRLNEFRLYVRKVSCSEEGAFTYLQNIFKINPSYLTHEGYPDPTFSFQFAVRRNKSKNYDSFFARALLQAMAIIEQELNHYKDQRKD